MNTNYDTATVTQSTNQIKEKIAVAIPEQANRYPSSVSSVSDWENNIEKMIQFVQQRTANVQGFLQSRFSLSEIAGVSIKTDSNSGYMRINNTDITTETRGMSDYNSWAGSYFSGTTQTFTAIPLEGHSFKKFCVTDNASGVATEYTASVIAVVVASGGITVEAIFDK